jgi:hypothetical protein
MSEELERLVWVHDDGQQLCVAERGRPIRGDMDRDPYDAGTVEKIEKTAAGASVLTAGRIYPIQIRSSQIRL